MTHDGDEDFGVAMGESENGLEETFAKASNFLAQNHADKEIQSHLLKFYGLYKQATCGPCNTARPGIFQLSAKAKWDAWNGVKQLSKTEAMTNYVELLDRALPTWSSAKTDKRVAVSTLASAGDEQKLTDEEKLITDFIKEGNIDRFERLLEESPGAVNELDSAGLGLIHWAADRNQLAVLRTLLKCPQVLVNNRDSDGQTALHYAACCGHIECCRLLLDHGADPSILNNEGETAAAIAFDSTIAHLLSGGS